MAASERIPRASLYAVSILVGAGCGTKGGSGQATVTARLLNGATPSAAGPIAPPRRTFLASDGNWQISPNKVRLTLQSLGFQVASGLVQTVNLSGCQVTYDRSQPGLTKLLDCPFSLQTGTYTQAFAQFNPSYDILIDDAANGIFTDPTSPTKLSRTAPAGGAQFISVTAPSSFGGSGSFAPPWVVTGSSPDAGSADNLTVSVVIDALQFFQATLTGGSAVIGVDGKGNVSAPSAVVAVGTPAAISFYANSLLGTALSYNAGIIGQGIYAISVLYSSTSTPSALSMRDNGQPAGCGPFGALYYYRGGFGYLGLDSSGTLGWAGTSATDTATGTPPYTSVMSMAQASALGASTTFKCMTTSADPAPAGGSFASGAPSIASPSLTLTMQLMAK